MHALTVFGQVKVDKSDAASWNRVIWRKCRSDDDADIDFALDSKEQVLEAIQALDSPALWELTHSLLFPKLLALAENYDHEAMFRLERQSGQARQVPELGVALATVSYRKGQYQLMAAFIVRGLIDGQDAGAVRSDLLGLLTMLLIDIDMPDAAEVAADLHEQCCPTSPEEVEKHILKRLDWRARIALRRGSEGIPVALQRMGAKRQRSFHPSYRELSWLLYISAWKDRESGKVSELTQETVADVLAALSKCDPSGEYRGNDDAPYMVRALACHSAFSVDQAALVELQRWIPGLTDRLTALDPGPWAFAALYLAMAEVISTDIRKRALAALEDAGYFHEAAAFAALLGDQIVRERAVARFLALRRQVLDRLSLLDDFPGALSGWLKPAADDRMSAIPM